MLEDILHLMTVSPHHRQYTVDTITRCILPPLTLGQHVYVAREGQLVAWCSWAWMAPDTAETFLHDRHKIQPHDWCAGDRLVLMDFIAPFGDALTLYSRVRNQFADEPEASWVRFAKDNKIVRVKNG